LEGTVASVAPQGGRKHPTQETAMIDTTNILFICGGAFDGLEKIIAQRINKKGTIGYVTDSGSNGARKELSKSELLAQANKQDLIKFGLIPELAGRLPVVGATRELTEDDMVSIMTEPK